MTRDKDPSAPRRTDDDRALSKSYDPHAIERRIYETWERAGYFAPRMHAPAPDEAGDRGRPPSGKDAAYCIMIPPPNVTGSLHMGHAFQDTLMDALIRYHRMKGYNTLWQAGTDHAGIATQLVVERQLELEGKTRHDLGREAFIERVWQWKQQSGDAITRQLRRMGASLDWSRERFTMDAGLSRAVAEVFVRLHEEGLIYRGKRLVNWDPVLLTAVSDLEVVAEEEPGFLWHIRYPLADDVQGRTNVAGDRTSGATGGHLVVATTRPETMLGDTAVAVHPEDERYKHLVGKQVELPLTGRKIPIVADEYVDRAFGSGCVKITPAHDFNDYEVGKRHGLPLLNILTVDAHIHLPGSKYHELDRYEARKRIVADLEAVSLLERVQEHKLTVPRGDRSGTVIEPYLTDQWFVRVGPLAEEAIRAVEDGRIRFVPENWSATYLQWMRNIQDWCISRQLWWGHQIPAWYCADCGAGDGSVQFHGGNWKARDGTPIGGGTIKIFDANGIPFEDAVRQARLIHIGSQCSPIVSRARPANCPVCSGNRLVQDPDVLDTWFSSALWPFSTLGWPEETPELKTFYPTSVLVTGFDIIFFWVARMIMMGLKFMGDVPFRDVYIHGLVRDAEGQKMSKSKGNILDPLDLIDGIDLEALVEKRTSGLMQPQMAQRIAQATRKQFPHGIQAYGADALRFTFASLATQGRDIKFDLGRIGGYRNFCNKLWNAARYVLMNTEGRDCGQDGGKLELNTADHWIISRLNQASAEAEMAIKAYRFDLAAQALYGFVWHEYCDWYLELSKVVLAGAESSEDAERGTRHTLVQVLEALLRLLHPLMPFITEELWQRVAPILTGPRVSALGSDLIQAPSPSGRGVGVRVPSPLAGEGVREGGKRTIMLQPYPRPEPEKIDAAAIAEMKWVMDVISAVRTIRAERDIAPAKPLQIWFAEGNEQEKQWWLQNHARYIKPLARADDVTWVAAEAAAPASAMKLVGETKVLVPLGSLIDKKAELERLRKEIERYQKELERTRAKLANPDFVARAPGHVVEQEKARAQQFEEALAKLQIQRARVAALPD